MSDGTKTNYIFCQDRSLRQALGLTAVVRDLHLTYPGEFLTDVRTPFPDLWENNPYLTSLEETNSLVQLVDCDYPLIHQSNTLPYHFIHAFRHFLNERLDLHIRPHAFKADIHLAAEEKQWLSQVDEITGMPHTRFWIIVAGGKTDFTAKWWDPERFQQVVDHFADRVLFVQCGTDYSDHRHHRLRGVIDLVGKTDLRQMVRLMHHAEGVVCPVTMFMHLAAAVETRPGRPRNRPCVVVAGGREPAQWEAYPHHRFLSLKDCAHCQKNLGESALLPSMKWDNAMIETDILDGSQDLDSVRCIHCGRMSGIHTSDIIQTLEHHLQCDGTEWTIVRKASDLQALRSF
jgi:hypothetical protein